MIWTGNSYVEDGVCPICFQPECPRSPVGVGIKRPPAGSIPSQLNPGQREYRGYQEWAIHPDEAVFLLHRGYAIVDGERAEIQFIHNEAFVTQIRVYGSDPNYSFDERFYGPLAKESDGKIAYSELD